MPMLGGALTRFRRWRAHVTHTDVLTGLHQAWTPGPNEPVFCVGTAASMSPVPDDTVFVGLDVRDMIELNDVHGHRVGDRLLAELGARLRRAAKPWPAYRTGGDEFLVVARLSNAAAIRALAEHLCAELQRPYGEIVIELSVATVRAAPGQTPAQLFEALCDGLAIVQRGRLTGPLIADASTHAARLDD